MTDAENEAIRWWWMSEVPRLILPRSGRWVWVDGQVDGQDAYDGGSIDQPPRVPNPIAHAWHSHRIWAEAAR